MKNKVVIVGGGAGGMVAATQLKKQSPDTEIFVFEKTDIVAWAGCPTPYYIADEVPYTSVVHYDAEYFRKNRDIKVYSKHNVEKIDFEKKILTVKGDSIDGEFTYDKLILSLGGEGFIPNIKGYPNNSDGVFRLSHATDAIKIKKYIDEKKPQKALVIGTGLIGIEMMETFSKLGMKVSGIEKMDVIFPYLNHKMRSDILEKMNEKNIELRTSTYVKEIKKVNDKKIAVLYDNTELEFDILLISIGIRPNTKLIENSINEKELEVNEYMQTQYKDVYAIGDMIKVPHLLKKEKVYAPLGDIANKQAVIAVKNILGQKVKYKGVIGTGSTSFFDIRIAKTGLTLEEALTEGYKAKTLFVKAYTKISGFGIDGNKCEIVYDEEEEIILGAVMTGSEAVAQFIDQFAIAITYKINIKEMFDVDYAYSPTNSTVWNPFLMLYRKLK